MADQQFKLKVPADTKVTATAGIGPRFEGGFGITTDLKVEMPGLKRADAEKLVVAFNNHHLIYALTWFVLAIMAGGAGLYVLLPERRR